MKANFPHIHQMDRQSVETFYDSHRPVFILSTGRCGSQWIVEACRLDAQACALHEPRPALMHLAGFPLSHPDQEMQKTILRASRFESMLDVYLSGKIYIESNQCLTFYLDALAELFPRAVFIHLLRHPGDFCASAIRKGWYLNDSIWEMGRIRPARPQTWEQEKNQIQKLGWYWTVINTYLRNRLQRLPADRSHTVTLERLVSDPAALAETLAFCGLGPVSGAEIQRLQQTPVNRLEPPVAEPPNMKKRFDHPAYPAWSEAHKDILRKSCPGAGDWGYLL